MSKRATKVDKVERIHTFVRLISNGAVTSELVRYAADRWGIGRRQAEVYIAEARQTIVDDIDMDRKQVVAELMHTSHTIVKAALKNGELNNAIGGMNVLIRLGGLEPGK